MEGLFVLDRYLADQDCIWMDNKWISKSGFEKAAGSTTAKWHCSIKVLACPCHAYSVHVLTLL